jgi:ABC-type glutathione transport system ATPase component
MSAALLEVEGLAVSFGERRVVRDLCLSVARGGALAIVGESGSGKSMSVAAIAGLTPPNAAARGSVRFDGIDLLDGDEGALARIRGRRIGFVFQDALGALNPFMRVGRQLGEGMRHHLGLDRAAARRRVAELLEEVGLRPAAGFVDRFPHQLSGGQRQRVAIAMAVACDPELLIADEPTSALDVTIQAQILDLLGRLRARRGLALILVSHDLAVVERICDHVLVMHAGEAVEQGRLTEVFAAPCHPYTRSLLSARAAQVPRASVESIGAPVAELRDITLSYPLGVGRGRVAALRKVSLRVGHGESVGLVGESGSGKSTVARALVGLAHADSGSVRVLGEDPVTTRDRRGFARRCQIVMQDPAGALNPRLRVSEALAEPLVEHGLCARRDLRARCADLLGEVGCSPSTWIAFRTSFPAASASASSSRAPWRSIRRC